MKQNEEKHIETVGLDKFNKAEAYAMAEIRKDGHFVGLNKIRDHIAFRAALHATGYDEEPLVFPRTAGKVTIQVQSLGETLLSLATAAARKAIAPQESQP
jgi:hypothetical protein